MIKENIVSLVDGFTVELNPKVRHKLNSIPLDKKNNVYITYLNLSLSLQGQWEI